MATTTVAADPRPTRTSSTSQWLRLARGAAVVMAVWAVTLQFVAGTLIPPVAVIGAVFAGFVPFLKGERRRLGLVLAAFTAAAFLGNLEVILDDLSNPDSAPTFILTLISTVGAGLALVSGLGAFFRIDGRPVRTLAVGAAGVVIAGAVASSVMAANTTSDAAEPGDMTVTAHQLMWAPESVTVDTSTSGLWIDNQDGIRHTFTVPELGIDLEVPAHTARRIDIEVTPGEYQIICTVPGHEAMTGTLIIES